MARRWESGEKRDREGKTTGNSEIYVWKCRMGNTDLKIIPNEKISITITNFTISLLNIQVKNTNEQ